VPAAGSTAAGGGAADPETAQRRAAQALWRVSCAGCHGPVGRGGGAELPPGAQVPNLADPAWQAKRSDEELAGVIREGRGMMPAFGDRIRPGGIDALVAHVRSLGRGVDGP
jgi:mono/diheme cytochrome c family protein